MPDTPSQELFDHAYDALDLLTKYRVLMTGWQLGTTPKGHPVGDALRDHRESSIVLEVEMSALLRLLARTLPQTAEEAKELMAELQPLFSEWQRGDPLADDPVAESVRDHRALTILHRVQLTALTSVLLQCGILTQDMYNRAIIEEADLLKLEYERRFPGVHAVKSGLTIDRRAQQTMGKWPR